MDSNVLSGFEERGLECPFVSSKAGDVITTPSGASIKAELSQMAMVIYETIGAIGDIKIDKIEIHGDAKGLLMVLDSDGMAGSVFEQKEGLVVDTLWNLLTYLKKKPPVKEEGKVVVEKPKEELREKPKVKLDPHVLDSINEKIREYLGDFSERIFKNQLKAQRIKVDDFYDEDARRLVFALGKAAGMIIGPSKGREMTNKLLELLK